MSEGGSIKAQLEQVEAELKAEADRWDEARIPFIGSIYRMNENEFMHHVHVLALTRMLNECLGITDDQITLMIKKVFVEEMKKTFPLVQDARNQALRNAIVDGVNIIRPPEV